MITVHANDAVVADWRRRIEAGWGSGTHSHTLAMVEGLVRELLDRTREPEAVLADIGRRCAADGHQLTDVVSWFSLLLELVPRRIRRLLESRTCGEALADGWAQGSLDLRPRLRRLASVDVVRLRLRELLDQCHALGLDLAAHYTLIVLDVDTGSLGPDARRAALRLVADGARTTFRAGETVAATDSGRILVLAPRRHELPAIVRKLVSGLQVWPELSAHRVYAWIEPLPRDCLHLAGLLDEIAV